MNLLYMMMLWMMISLFLLLINLIMSLKSPKNREKISPFECGFDPLNNNRIPFSIQFFLISLIFLIFDIELTLLIPLIYLLINLNKIMILSALIFLIILIFGLIIEYMEQSIDWKI
uniref:NADH-ubiquinone oxidoreductase chain 3 n=1 Tax=Brachymyrmex patagonicus TaxID=604570 RepID=A0A2U8XC31_9HYME|nr:NADH dehydrogenase subunit 3 [Brachymyrmex patagonicus]